MVTRAGKKLLRNTIHTVDHHNKVLEEQDMWRQWELQQGLTMMVSDDAVRSRAKYLRMKMEKCLGKQESEHSKAVNIDLNKKDVESLKKMRNYWLNKLVEAEEKDPDRWGHSGFKELYPEEFKLSASPKHSRAKPHERKKERKKHKKKLAKRSASSTDYSETYSDLSDNNSHKSKTLKRTRRSMPEDASGTIDSTGDKSNCKKLKKQKHHSLSKPAKSKKKNKKHKSTSKKTYKKRRCTSESSVEEVWVEKSVENRDSETSVRDSSSAALKDLSYINSSSSDSIEDNFLINPQYFQNRNMPGS